MKSDFIGIGSGLKAIGQAIFLLVVFLFFVGIVMGLMAYHIASEHLPRNNNKTIEAPVKTEPPQPKVNPPPAKPKEVEAPPESGPSDGGEIVLPVPSPSERGEREVPILRRPVVR
jgi:phage shock protein PspC (stress-responsive transcriptional regulator)